MTRRDFESTAEQVASKMPERPYIQSTKLTQALYSDYILILSSPYVQIHHLLSILSATYEGKLFFFCAKTHISMHIFDQRQSEVTLSEILRMYEGSADKSLARPISPFRRTGSIVSLERGLSS